MFFVAQNPKKYNPVGISGWKEMVIRKLPLICKSYFKSIILTRFSEAEIWLLLDQDMTSGGQVVAQACVHNFFYVQLLLHYSRDFDQTFTEALSSSAQWRIHVLSVLCDLNIFGELWPFVIFISKNLVLSDFSVSSVLLTSNNLPLIQIPSGTSTRELTQL